MQNVHSLPAISHRSGWPDFLRGVMLEQKKEVVLWLLQQRTLARLLLVLPLAYCVVLTSTLLRLAPSVIHAVLAYFSNRDGAISEQ